MRGDVDLGDLFLALLYSNLAGAAVALLLGDLDGAALFVLGMVGAGAASLGWEAVQ